MCRFTSAYGTNLLIQLFFRLELRVKAVPVDYTDRVTTQHDVDQVSNNKTTTDNDQKSGKNDGSTKFKENAAEQYDVKLNVGRCYDLFYRKRLRHCLSFVILVLPLQLDNLMPTHPRVLRVAGRVRRRKKSLLLWGLTK
jgi:hypothetical protein